MADMEQGYDKRPASGETSPGWWNQPYGSRAKARPGSSLDLRFALFHIPGGKIHRLENHPNSLVNTMLMFVANAKVVKGGGGSRLPSTSLVDIPAPDGATQAYSARIGTIPVRAPFRRVSNC